MSVGDEQFLQSRLEAQSAQIAELQAEVERLKRLADILGRLAIFRASRATAAEAQIADLKRALDTARHDAMEVVAWTRQSDLKLLKEHWPMVAVISAATEKSGNLDVPLFAASPLSQGGQE